MTGASTERRRRRSANKDEALGLLLERVMARSQITSIAVVDEHGAIVRGAGPDRELVVLGAVAAPFARGAFTEICERLTHGTDVLASPVRGPRGTLYLAALGARVSRMREAARGVERILST